MESAVTHLTLTFISFCCMRLMETLLDLADNWLMLVRVELEVYADNERAIHLYEKLGFEQEGLLRMTTVRNGRYVDEYKMARIRPGVTAP